MKIGVSNDAGEDGFATLLMKVVDHDFSVVTKDGKAVEGRLIAVHTNDDGKMHAEIVTQHWIPVEQIETVTYL